MKKIGLKINNLFGEKNKITKKLEYMVGNKEMDLIDKKSTLKLFNYLNSEKIINIQEDYIFELAAGNGRVTESILCKLFNNIDVLEQSEKLASNIQIRQNNNKNIIAIKLKILKVFALQENTILYLLDGCLAI